MIDLKQIPFYVLFVVAGILAGSLFFGGEKEFDSTILQENYDLKNENQRLRFETKLDSIESKHEHEFILFKNADSTERSIILTNLGY